MDGPTRTDLDDDQREVFDALANFLERRGMLTKAGAAAGAGLALGFGATDATTGQADADPQGQLGAAADPVDTAYIDTIVEGEPTWEGQDLEACQRRIEESGLASFLRECQHEVEDVEGALWTREQLESIRVNTHPTLTRILIGVDPSGGTAETGIIAGGLGRDRKGYILEDGSMGGEDPNAWGRKIVSLFHKWEADAVVAEKNYGGSMVRSTILSATGENVQVPVYLVPSTSRKYTRAEPVAAAYGSKDVDWQDTKVHHVGTFSDLEHQQRTFVPGNESPDRLDALVHLLRKLVVNLGRNDGGSSLPNTQSR